MKLNYTVQHVQDVMQQKTIEHEGASATLTYPRKRVELVAEGHDGGTILLILPVNTNCGEEGAIIEVDFLFAVAEAPLELTESQIVADEGNAVEVQ
jgi:non-canonical (house-cleaning) NTP pyrophosphatase